MLDWNEIQSKVSKCDWALEIYNEIKSSVDWWMENYKDDPSRIVSIGHDYFCDLCHSSLQFRADNPNVHLCEKCSVERLGERINQAWTCVYRNELHKHMYYAGVLFNMNGDERYLQFIKRIMAFYCEHYGRFQIAPLHVPGKFAGSILADAMAVVWQLQSLQLIKHHLSEEELADYKTKWFVPMKISFEDAYLKIHNIKCWLSSAVAMMGLFFGEDEWTKQSVHGLYGLQHQLKQGLSVEGFWYEGSFTYQFYTAQPITYFLYFCQIYGYSQPFLEKRLVDMYEYPVMMSFPNGRFPNPNDGWPLISYSTYSGQYEWMRYLFPNNPYFANVLNRSYGTYYQPSFNIGEMNTASPSGGVQRLLFGDNEYVSTKKMMLLPRFDDSSQFCILRADQAVVFLKCGLRATNHAHYDVMNMELFLKNEVISYDISNSGYGSPLVKEWQKTTIAHNTVTIDEINQPNIVTGRIDFFDQETNHCTIAADNVYPGINFERTCQLEADRLIDEFTVRARKECQSDWCFYCEGELISDFKMETPLGIGKGDGYQHLEMIANKKTDHSWEVMWKMADKSLTLHMEGEPGTTIYIVKGFKHDASMQRYGVIVRRRSTHTEYKVNYLFS